MAASTAQRNDSGMSPSSSPRLPSPPPFTEVQFGPKSPSISGAPTEFSLDSKEDDGASRRIRPGTKAADMAKGPPFVPLHQLESAFQLQEYLMALHSKLIHDDTSRTLRPLSKEMALEMAAPPTAQDTGEAVERNLWLYELCRFLCKKTSRLIVGFFNDMPPCSSQTCPEMRASEWQYLCAVHEPPKSCCAIDYCNHTLDWASNILSSSKHFPSRLQLGGEAGNAYQSMKQLTNIFRRVYRIYAHAWFQHREVFWTIEAELGLYMLFKTVCDHYQLIPEDNYTIPPEAEGEREEKQIPVAQNSPERTNTVSILQKTDEQAEGPGEEEASSAVSTGATTRRHRHTPSTGVPVAVIAEGQEEEEEETTILDTSDPGPTLESSPSLSPPKPRTDRAKSPGLIAIPKNEDPDRAPEDPTPIALYDTNPFGSPGPAEVEEKPVASTGTDTKIVAEEPEIKTEQALEHSKHDEQNSEAESSTSSAEPSSGTTKASLEIADNQNSAKVDDGDSEAPAAAGATKGTSGEIEDAESMDKIEISEIETKAEDDKEEAEPKAE